MNLEAVYVFAPQGRGKTRHAAELAELLDCNTIIDDWDGQSPVPNGALVLTNLLPPMAAKAAA